MLTIAIAPQSAQAANITGGRTTTNSYVKNVPGNGGYEILPLVTVGDEVQLLAGDLRTGLTKVDGKTFAFAGIPDGLGLFESGGYNYVFANHEIAATNASAISSTVPGQIKGARVSLLQFDKDWNAVGGKNLIETVVDNGTTYSLDTTTGAYIDPLSSAAFSFSRFCSAYLAEYGFVDKDGKPAPIYFAPEEFSPGGRGFAVSPDGTATALNDLGRYSKENVLAASQYRAENSDKTVLISTEDNADGEVYMFVGQQTQDDPNGFENGELYVMKVDQASNETLQEGVPTGAKWTLVDKDVVVNPDGTVLSKYVNEEGRSTNFRRPEDIHEDPNKPGTFYFVTTGGTTTNENPYGKLYRFSLNPSDPAANINDFELLLSGGPGKGVSYDNIVVDRNGNIMIQEDESGSENVMKAEGRDARIWSYNIASGKMTPVFEIEDTAGGTLQDPGTGIWESSGIIEVNPNAKPGRSSYLFDVQAHSIKDPKYVEGGQLILAKPVPESSTTAALYLFGLAALGLKLKRQTKDA